MKRFIALMLCAAAALALCACGKIREDDPADTQAPTDAQTVTEEPKNGIEVLDMEGKRLGVLPESSSPTMTDRGIFCCVTPELGFGTAEYRLFDPETGEDRLLGVVEEQSYETSYCRAELDGRLYTAAVTGDLMDGQPDTLWLLSIDLVNGGIDRYKVNGDGFPYAAVAVVNGRVMIMEHDQKESLFDRIWTLDTSSGELTEAICYELDGGASNGDTARFIAESEGQLRVLRVHFENGAPSLYIDSYDRRFAKTGERDITAITSDAILQCLTPDDVSSELAQPVCGFSLDGGILYYANFSATHFIADIVSGEILSPVSDLFNASTGSGKTFYCLMLPDDGGNALFELENGRLKGSVFPYWEEGELIVSASVSKDGRRIVTVRPEVSSGKSSAIYYSNR